MEAPPGLIALRDATDMVGHALYETSWCPLSEAFSAERRIEGHFEIEASAIEVATEVILLKLNPEIERTITTIAEWAVSGELVCVYFSARGREILDPGEWQRQLWRSHFVEGKIDLVVPLLGENGKLLLDEKGNIRFTPSRCTFEIFVEQRGLKRLIAALSKPVTEQPELVATQSEPVAKLTEQQQQVKPEEKQQTSAAEEALGNSASPEQAVEAAPTSPVPLEQQPTVEALTTPVSPEPLQQVEPEKKQQTAGLRPPKRLSVRVDWDDVKRKLYKRYKDAGPPDPNDRVPHWRRQADAERFVGELLVSIGEDEGKAQIKDIAAESTIRAHVKRLTGDYLKAKAEK
jgi:hypothetical protein